MMQASFTSRCYPSSFHQRPVKPYFGTDKSSKDSEDDTTSSSKSHLTKSEHSESSGHSKRKESTSTDSLHKSSDAALPSAKEQHQAVSEADSALKATSRWLDQLDQPAGKLPKLPAAPPSATLTNTESLQKAISRGDLSGFSNSFEHNLSQINSAQGRSEEHTSEL